MFFTPKWDRISPENQCSMFQNCNGGKISHLGQFLFTYVFLLICTLAGPMWGSRFDWQYNCDWLFSKVSVGRFEKTFWVSGSLMRFFNHASFENKYEHCLTICTLALCSDLMVIWYDGHLIWVCLILTTSMDIWKYSAETSDVILLALAK